MIKKFLVRILITCFLGSSPPLDASESNYFLLKSQIISNIISTLVGPFLRGYVDNIFFKPAIALEYGPAWYRQPFFDDSRLFEGLVYSRKTQKDLTRFIARLDLAASQGRNLPNLALYGPPGTGKTEIARRFGKRNGYTYAFLSGSSVMKYPSYERIKQLTDLFKWANKRSRWDRRKVILFFDEAELMLKSRKLKPLPEDEKVLLEFMTLTGSGSKNFSVIVATNRPQNLDKALYRRLSTFIEIDRPGKPEIISLIDMYLAEFANFYPTLNLTDIRESESISDISNLVEKMSPAQIKEIIDDSLFRASATGEEISIEHFSQAVDSMNNQNNLNFDYLE